MKFKDFTDLVSQHADTKRQGIDVADVSRVLAVTFDTLNELKAGELWRVISAGLDLAEKRKAKKK